MSRKFCILNCESSEAENILLLLKEYSDFECAGISQDYNSSINLVLKYLPEIIIIDIDRNTSSSSQSPYNLVQEIFQYLDYFPSLIAVSANTSKAYDVIKLGFYDYLLKPLSEVDIRKSVLRLKKNFNDESPQKICLKSHSDYRFIDLNNILYLQADNNSTDFYLKNEKVVSGFKTLKFYETILPSNFLRVHNSYVINIHHLFRINFGKSSIALVGVNKNIPFSRSHKDEVEMLRKSLNSLNAVQA